MSKSDRISLVIVLIAALVVIPHLLDLLGALGGSSGALAVIDALFVLLGVGLLTRNELARRIYIALSLLGVFFILLGSNSESFGWVFLALVLQILPVVFLSLSSVKSKFA
jgi:hypothetical protein